ncbi:hypothetical protein [Cellulomonas sp. C5510]|uniref:hypothetical protein n=1 Tax=Cellulomonas sp. C5510 TaxID=2871170 RepID=UPI001C980D57|nr:hypothetical protein [Cellulomonas sp. C5510]QZN86365.1 hypothetical protein K5O09_04095 [Cellulomonas sp. C5510]
MPPVPPAAPVPARGAVRTAAEPGSPSDRAAARRDRRRAGTALALVLPALLAGGGCGPETARPPAAEVATAPDCLATDVLWELGLTPPEGHDRPAPAAGSVPGGFLPVSAVHCRGPLDGPVQLVEPTAPGGGAEPAPGLLSVPESDAVDLGDLPAVPEAPDPGRAAVTVTEVELAGDLGPLLAQLARPSRVAGPDQACTAMWQSQPQVYLVDADGRAVRVQWPSDECGYPLDGVTSPLAVLRAVGTRVLVAEPA